MWAFSQAIRNGEDLKALEFKSKNFFAIFGNPKICFLIHIPSIIAIGLSIFGISFSGLMHKFHQHNKINILIWFYYGFNEYFLFVFHRFSPISKLVFKTNRNGIFRFITE